MADINITEIRVQVLSAPPAAVTFIKYWNGVEWVDSELKVYDGSNWVDAQIYAYDGTDWITV